jgi:hypothetical protein
MNNPPQHLATGNRRHFRFGLRTLLLLVTLAAVGSWGYWIGWPSWQAFRQRKTFESNVRSLKVGDHLTGATNLAGAKIDGLIVFQQAEAMYWKTGMCSYELPGATYCIFGEFPRLSLGTECVGIEVYLLPPMPPGYRSQRSKSNSHLKYMSSHSDLPVHYPQMEYTNDFFCFLNGDRKNNPGFQYELIYSDPPAKPAGK